MFNTFLCFALTLIIASLSADVNPQDISLSIKMASVINKYNQNYVFSPFNLKTAINVYAAGTKDKTCFAELQHSFTHDYIRRESGFLSKYQDYKNDATEILILNELFVKKRMTINPSYANGAKTIFGALVTPISYKSPDRTIKAINARVAKATHNKIQDLFSPGDITSKTIIASVNTLYFKGLWELPFDKKLTTQLIFHTEDGREVLTPMMNAHLEVEQHTDRENSADFLILNHKETNFKTVLILPSPKSTLKAFEAKLFKDPNILVNALKETYLETSSISIPLIDRKTNLQMKTILTNSNLSCIFNHGLNNIVNSQALSLDEMVHKVNFQMNEAGSEGAAATGGAFGSRSLNNMFFNKPFLHLLIEAESGNVLFWGRYSSPD